MSRSRRGVRPAPLGSPQIPWLLQLQRDFAPVNPWDIGAVSTILKRGCEKKQKEN